MKNNSYEKYGAEVAYEIPSGCMADPHYFRSKEADEDPYGRIQYAIQNYNGAEQELYYAKVFTEEDGALEGWDEPRYYFTIINEDGSYDPETFLLGFAVWEESNGPLAEIKMQNGWYGDA